MIFSVSYRYRKINRYIENINIYMHIKLYIEFLASYFRDPSRWKQWYIEIYRVGDNWRTVNTSTSPHISGQLGQTTRVNNCYVDLSSSYEFWFPIIFIDMNVIFYRNPPILIYADYMQDRQGQTKTGGVRQSRNLLDPFTARDTACRWAKWSVICTKLVRMWNKLGIS